MLLPRIAIQQNRCPTGHGGVTTCMTSMDGKTFCVKGTGDISGPDSSRRERMFEHPPHSAYDGH